jgi:hypothetical protein
LEAWSWTAILDAKLSTGGPESPVAGHRQSTPTT